jgi:hypothetical protein
MTNKTADYLQANQIVSTIAGWLIENAINDGISSYHADLYHDANELRQEVERYIESSNSAQLAFLFQVRCDGNGTNFCNLQGRSSTGQHSRTWWNAAMNKTNPYYRITINRNATDGERYIAKMERNDIR